MLIETIKIPELENKDYSFIEKGKKLCYVPKLSKMNIFLGSNNSGKSMFIRSLISNGLKFKNNYTDELSKAIFNLKKDIKSYFNNHNVSMSKQLNDYLEELKIDNFQEENDKNIVKLLKIKKLLEQMKNNKNSKYSSGKSVSSVGIELFNIFKNIEEPFGNNFEKVSNIKFERFYIPILRGIRKFDFITIPDHIDINTVNSKDIYKLKTKRDYFERIDIPIEIFTGLNVYYDIKKYLLGSRKKREAIKAFEEFLSEEIFDGQTIEIIPSEENQKITIKIGLENERQIQNLGDGIQALIICLLPLFLNQDENILLFIEEPELCMHPGLQRKLIRTLVEYPGFRNAQYFITTHSNHLLDLTFDFDKISIYSIEKEYETQENDIDPLFLIKNLSSSDFKILELLGVRNSSVFLSNCTIWVEGITDRLYLRQYLKLYQDKLIKENKVEKRFDEDRHYSFVEYSGNNITHWSFLDQEEGIDQERVCSKIFLIADKDNNKEERHEKLKETLGDRFYKLNCLEIENIISKKILIEVLNEYEKGNLELKNTFSETNYKDIGMGAFIEDIIQNKKRNGSYAQESGTITDKLNFCKKTIKNTKGWDDLSEEAKELTKKIYEFIKENNN